MADFFHTALKTQSEEISAEFKPFEHLNFSVWVEQKQLRIEHLLEKCLPPEDVAPKMLHSAMRYSTIGGGKRIRALLCYAAAEFCNTEPVIADAAACAVELIHAYSLVHDDMPCMDNDDLRRGKPSCHLQYDEATALLVGDGLQSLAFEVLARPTLCLNHAFEPVKQIRMLHILAQATGSAGMAGGQSIDLASTGHLLTLGELETMHSLKTGALIRAAANLGAINGTNKKIAAIHNYANNIGLAYQVIDDILDVEANTLALGKTAGKDANNHKPTYVSLLGLMPAKALAQELYENAIAVLQPFQDGILQGNIIQDSAFHDITFQESAFPVSTFQDGACKSGAKRLCELADFITKRSF